MRILLKFSLFMLIIAPLSAASRPDFIISAITVGGIKYFYMEEKAYIESGDAKHPFALLAQFPKKLRGFSIDQFNHAQLADWYEQLHHGNEMNISYEEIKEQPFAFMYMVYLLTGAFHVDEEQPVTLSTLRKNIHSEALAKQFFDHKDEIGIMAGEYFSKYALTE